MLAINWCLSLAQQPAPTSEDRAAVLFWCGVLLVAAMALGLIAWFLRRRFGKEDPPDASAMTGMGFTLADLRQMRDEGQLSVEEYDYARRKLIAKTRQSMEQASPEDPLPNARAEPLDPAEALDPDASGDFPTPDRDPAPGATPDRADNAFGPDKTGDGNVDDGPDPRAG